MCIIAIYENNKRPTRDSLRHMMNTNPDGVGVAWNDGKRVYFKKGFKDIDRVFEFINSIEKAKTVVFHARISTSGGISAQKCHPFPISDRAHVLNKLSGSSIAPVVFHNGVFPITPEKGLNDTQTFIKYALTPLAKNDPRGLYKGEYDEIIELATRNSRVCILYPDRVITYGEWITNDGILYSNRNFEPYKWGGYGSRLWDSYRYDDDEIERYFAKRYPAKQTTAKASAVGGESK